MGDRWPRVLTVAGAALILVALATLAALPTG